MLVAMESVKRIVYNPGVVGMTLKQLTESSDFYTGPFAYVDSRMFRPISMRNFGYYTILGRDDEFTHTVVPGGNAGYVFFNQDIVAKPNIGMPPVMTVLLRDSTIKGYKQAYSMRIQEAFEMRGTATRWHLAYVRHYGGIVSDFEHLEGGKRAWKPFVRTATDHGLKISLVDTVAGQWMPVNANTPEEAIWSLDDSKKPLALVLEALKP